MKVHGDIVRSAIGEVSREVVEAFDLPSSSPVVFFELDLAQLLPHVGESRRYHPLSRYPAVQRDLAIIVNESVPAQRVEQVLAESRLVVAVSLFDVYHGGQVQPGKKSLAYHLVYQSPKRTLNDAEVDAAPRRALLNRLRNEVGVTLRS